MGYTVGRRKIDRVRLVKKIASSDDMEVYHGARYIAEQYAELGQFKKDKKKYTTNFVRSFTGKEGDTSFCYRFFAAKTCPAIGIDFTPAALSADGWAEFSSDLNTMFDFGASYVWDSFDVSSIEIAFDAIVSFSDLIFVVPGVTSVKEVFYKSGTLYLGGKYSPCRFRIYDKRKHLAEKKGVVITEDRTRIEVVRRNLGLTLGEIGTLDKPFGRLVAVRGAALERLVKKYPNDSALISFAKMIAAGEIAQRAYLKMGASSRKRIVKLLKRGMLQLNPAEGDWSKWVSGQCNQLQKQFLGAG